MDGQYYPQSGDPSAMAPPHEDQEPHDHDECASQCGDTGDGVCCDNDACAPPNAFAIFCSFEGCQPDAVCHDQACPSMLPCHDDTCVDQVALCSDETCFAASHPCTDTNCNYFTISSEHGGTLAGHPQHAAPHQLVHHQHDTHHSGLQHNGLQHNDLQHNDFQHNGHDHQALQQPELSQSTILQPFGDSNGLEDINFGQSDANAAAMMGYLSTLDMNSHSNNFFPTDLPLSSTQNVSWPYTQQLPDADQTIYGGNGNFSLPSSSIPATPMSTFSMPRSISATPASLSSAECPAPSFVNPDAGPSQPPSNAVYMCKWRPDPMSDQICGEICENDNALQDHCKKAHVQPLERVAEGFHCQWLNCERANPFTQKSKLERHLQVHTGFKPVQCHICNQWLSAKQSLQQHMRTHTGEKPWGCPVPGCNQAFKQQSALTMHQRTHTGEKPLQCEVCGKKFGESSNLSKHRKTHNVKGTHVCQICGRDFHRQDQLRRHRKTHERKGVATGTTAL